MARYGKTLKNVLEFVQRAMRNGEAVINGINRETGKYETRYKMVIKEFDNGQVIGVVSHYGTRVLVYNLTEGEIMYSYNSTSSGRDMMNNVLDALGHKKGEYFKMNMKEKLVYLVREDDDGNPIEDDLEVQKILNPIEL